MNTSGHNSRARLLLIAAALGLVALLAACDSQSSQPPDPDPITEPVFTPTALVCPSEPEPITVDVAGPESSELVRGRSLIDGRDQRSFECQIQGDGSCRLATRSLASAGTYSLILELPDTSQMRIVDGRVEYDYQPFQLTLAQGSRRQGFTEEAVSSVTLDFSVRYDESNCLFADFRDVVHATQPAAEPQTEIHLNSGIVMTDLGSDVCQLEPADKLLTTEVFLPAGTDLADVQVVYEIGGRSHLADCQAYGDAYICTAVVRNPIIAQTLAIRAIVGDEVYTNFQLPFNNLCIYFSD